MAAQNFKLWLKQLRWQSAILFSLQLQVYGHITIFKLHQAEQDNRVLSYFSRKRNIVLKKRKYIKARNYVEKKTFLWVRFAERTDT